MSTNDIKANSKEAAVKSVETIIAEVISKKLGLGINPVFMKKLTGFVEKLKLSGEKVKVELVDAKELKDILFLTHHEWHNDKNEIVKTGTMDEGAIVEYNEGEEAQIAFGVKTIVHKRQKSTAAIKLPKSLLTDEVITTEPLFDNPNISALILKKVYNQKGSTTTLYCYNIDALAVNKADGENSEENLLHLAQSIAKTAGKKNVKYILTALKAIDKEYGIGGIKLKVKNFKYNDADEFDRVLTKHSGHEILKVEQLYLEEGEAAEVSFGYINYTKTENGTKSNIVPPKYDDTKSYVVLVREQTKYGFTYFLNAYNI